MVPTLFLFRSSYVKWVNFEGKKRPAASEPSITIQKASVNWELRMFLFCFVVTKKL